MNLQHYYPSEGNQYLASLIPPGAYNILDVGCATGGMGRLLKKGRSCRVVGIEVDPRMAQEARQVMDEVIEGDVETQSLTLEENSFDCVLYGDVLEHMRNPWQVLERHKAYLKPGGRALACIPNVQNFRIIGMLLAGKWEYTDSGLMDSTHLRWFTRREIYKLFESAGYKNIQIKPIPLPPRVRMITRILHKTLPDYFTRQYLVSAEK